MTPTEVWEGFDPTKGALENSIISSEAAGNIICSKQYFTADAIAGDRIRAYCEIYYDKRWADDRAAVLIIPSLTDTKYMKLAKRLVEEGYVACILDYYGNSAGADIPHTTFPQELSFATLPGCLTEMTSLKSDARHTPWFIWTKIARKAITCLQEQRIVADDRIGVIGMGVGAQIAWQVAGTDTRVRALIPINGDGYLWANGMPKFTSSNIPSSDEASAFSTGVGAETYAKFVSCPTLIITSADSTYSDVDRAGDVYTFVKSELKQLLITRGVDSQISGRAFEALLVWLRKNFALDGVPSVTPTINFEKIDDALYLRINSAGDTVKKQVYYCFGEPHPFARRWRPVPIESLQKTGEHEYTCNIPVYDADDLVVAYATFEYEDGNMISAPIIATVPSKLGLSKSPSPQAVSTHLIYNNSMGFDAFTPATDDALLDENIMFLKDGPFDIKGISTQSGSLSLCFSMNELKSLGRSSALQFDAYSPEPKRVIIELYTFPERKKYTAHFHLKGGEFWQKVLLEYADFKSEEGKALQKFSDTKLMTIVNAEGIAFNNFLWI